MAYVRFGEDGSQVYIYPDSETTAVCCMCYFTPRAKHGEYFRTADLEAMLTHVAEHRAAGHVVPAWVDDQLREEWDQEWDDQPTQPVNGAS